MLHILTSGLAAFLHPMHHLLMLLRSVKKSPPARYGKPVMVADSESGAGSDAGQGSTSDGEDIFPASYQPPLAGIISKGKLKHQSRSARLVLLPSTLSMASLC